MIAVLVILLAIVGGFSFLVGHTIGWSANIHRRHKACIARGYRQGLMEGEDERDVLKAHLAELGAKYDGFRASVTEVADTMQAVFPPGVPQEDARRAAQDFIDAEEAREKASGHRDHELIGDDAFVMLNGGEVTS